MPAILFEQMPVFEKESYNQQIENFPLNVGFESNWVSKLLFFWPCDLKKQLGQKKDRKKGLEHPLILKTPFQGKFFK